MKLFRTSDINVVEVCCGDMFHFELPSATLVKRTKKFMDK